MFTKMYYTGQSLGNIYNIYSTAQIFAGEIIEKLISSKN